MIDPYYPHAPSLIDRRFNLNREISEKEVEEFINFNYLCTHSKRYRPTHSRKIGQRPLEPFDIWYNGFKGKSDFNEELLDQKVGKIIPFDVESFQKDIPYILRKIGFSPQKSEFLAQHIAVDPIERCRACHGCHDAR